MQSITKIYRPVKWSLSHSQARAWFQLTSGGSISTTVKDIRFALENKNEFIPARTFADFVDVNIIGLED